MRKKKLNKVLFFFIALGTVLPMMHQSSLGTLLVVMGSPDQSALADAVAAAALFADRHHHWLRCRAVRVLRGFCRPIGRKIETHLLTPMAKVMLGVLAVYLIVRLAT